MRSRKQTPPELNGDHVDDAAGETESVDALAAEEAEAEAAEAEAVAAAARARARALRLRREAAAAAEAKAAETVAAPEADTGDETDADDETGEVEGDNDSAVQLAGEPVRRRRGVRIPLPPWKVIAGALTILVIAALLAACGYMYWSHRQVLAEQQRRAEFEAAARQGVVTLMSLDYTRAKEDVQRIIDNATGQFKDDFKNQADDFIKVAQDSKVITEVTVNATGVESMTDNSAVVLVSASSRVTNAAGAKQEPRTWRLSVDLERVGDQIKMSNVEFVQ